VFFLSGGFGWYATLAAVGVFDMNITYWYGELLVIISLVGALWSIGSVGNEVERWVRPLVDQRWKKLHYVRRMAKREKAIKWMIAPLVLWILPLVLAMFQAANN
jgi:uncharacterized membrane protein